MGWALRSIVPTLLAAALAGADRPVPADEAWKAIRALRFDDALRIARADSSPNARLAEATALTQSQPVTRENLSAAKQLLTDLADGSQTPPEIAIAARYQLARLLQLDPFGSDLPEAVAVFERLVQDHPDHPLAQTAVVKLAIIQLYNAPDDASRAERFAEYERRVAVLSDPFARRDLHMTLATVASRKGMPPGVVLAHLQAVDVRSVAKDRSLADLLVRRGETALAANNPAAARLAFEGFLSRFPADQRAYYIRQQLESLPTGRATN